MLFKKWKRILALYDDLYFSYKTKNNSTLGRSVPNEEGRIGVDFIASYDKLNVTYYYVIRSFPKELMKGYRERLRRVCMGDVRITFIDDLVKHTIEWDSAAMRSRLRILKQIGEENSENNVDAYNLHANLGTMQRQSWVEESLNYLADADKVRKRALIKYSCVVVITGTRGEIFDDSIKMIEQEAKNLGLDLERVLYEIPDFISHTSPFSSSYMPDIDKYMPVQVLTDEIIARFNTFTQGKLGIGDVYFGTDIESCFPVLSEVKPKVDTAENWLVTAATGEGKSVAVKVLVKQLLGKGCNGTIMDIEGFEYIPLANFMSHNSKVVVVNMAEGSGKYFEPMEIAPMSGVESIDSDAKNLSVNFTLAVFKVLLGRAYKEDIWLDIVVDDAVSETYKSAGVTDNRETWGKSKGLALKDVYLKLFELRTFRDEKEYKTAVEKAIAASSRYFEEGGTRAGLFREKVVIEDITDADLVICSFGMAGKSPQAVDETQMALMQLGAAQLSHQRSIHSKSMGKFNFKLWEEFQRWGKFPDADKTIGVAVTGGRKLGDINIIVTNLLSELLSSDRFDIFENITSFMVGAILDEKVRKDFTDRLSIPEMKEELDLVASMTGMDGTSHDDLEDEPYKFSFLCGLNRKKYAIVKMMLPKGLKNSALFRTGVEGADKSNASDKGKAKGAGKS